MSKFREPNEIEMKNSHHNAVLWDLDGTIVDSAPYHKLAWHDTFSGWGINFTEDVHRFSLGRRNNEIIRRYMGSKMSQREVDLIAEQKEEKFREYIKDDINPCPGVVEIIESLASAEVPLAIVSSATIENIRLITEKLHINSFFNLFVTGKDVIHGKPNPQGFLMAANKLRVEPRHCIVIEDAVAGVGAAENCGMYCIAVTNTCSKQDLAEADIVVDRLDELKELWPIDI